MFLDVAVHQAEENSVIERADTSISFLLLQKYIHGDLQKYRNNNKYVFMISKNLIAYLNDLKRTFKMILYNRSDLVKELFYLYQISNSLYLYNCNVLKVNNSLYRSRVLFPNLIYLLQRHLPTVKIYLQRIIREVYNEIRKKSSKLVNLYENSLYLDADIIKHNVLLEFLGNGLRHCNPLDVGNINAYYKAVFRKIFDYYFRKEQSFHTIYSTNFWNIPENDGNTNTRLTVYRDVLYDLQVNFLYLSSPLYIQLGYNYRIFRNLIINNELQNVYLISSSNDHITSNNEYKLLKVYSDDILDTQTLSSIRKLPTVFRLLKCVHIVTDDNSTKKCYDESVIKPELLKTVVRDELMNPFKNLFNESYIISILDRVAENFVTSILKGEYINLLTLSSVVINQISFAEQLRKFIRTCFDEFTRRKNKDNG